MLCSIQPLFLLLLLLFSAFYLPVLYISLLFSVCPLQSVSFVCSLLPHSLLFFFFFVLLFFFQLFSIISLPIFCSLSFSPPVLVSLSPCSLHSVLHPVQCGMCFVLCSLYYVFCSVSFFFSAVFIFVLFSQCFVLSSLSPCSLLFLQLWMLESHPVLVK